MNRLPYKSAFRASQEQSIARNRVISPSGSRLNEQTIEHIQAVDRLSNLLSKLSPNDRVKCLYHYYQKLQGPAHNHFLEKMAQHLSMLTETQTQAGSLEQQKQVAEVIGAIKKNQGIIDLLDLTKQISELKPGPLVRNLLYYQDKLQNSTLEYFLGQISGHYKYIQEIQQELECPQDKAAIGDLLDKLESPAATRCRVQNKIAAYNSRHFLQQFNTAITSPTPESFDSLYANVEQIEKGHNFDIQLISDPVLKQAIISKKKSILLLAYLRTLIASCFDPNSSNYRSIFQPGNEQGIKIKTALVALPEIQTNQETANRIKKAFLDTKYYHFLPGPLKQDAGFKSDLSAYLKSILLSTGEQDAKQAQLHSSYQRSKKLSLYEAGPQPRFKRRAA